MPENFQKVSAFSAKDVKVPGMWIAMLGLARPGWIGLALAFMLFRLLDITKPGPVGWADRQAGAGGIMGDDVIAGVIAAVILWAVSHWFPAAMEGSLP